ncbi:hypothetical protein KL86CLO1_11670 [uncultured Eubacteriales bacterium]|uniref:HTH cro/C1-type domain-containing protein n=1 Tax=uncultured Eubacteriales bacterium TaxID=172733 RepID=A0A212JT85_9FIRM|nr:hypothetical protein KL86CLO1_11670 [uncultured Eubacteriales bacterium]
MYEVTKNMYEIFAKLLDERGITAYQVHKAVGVSQSVLSAWKNGVNTPRNPTLKKIADYFGVSVAYLKGEANDKKPTPVSEGGLNDPIIAQIMDIVRQLPPETQLRSLEYYESLLALQKSAQAPNTQDSGEK